MPVFLYVMPRMDIYDKRKKRLPRPYRKKRH